MIVKVIEDDEGNLCLEFTDEQLKELGLEVGDTIEWKEEEDGVWSLSKKE